MNRVSSLVYLVSLLIMFASVVDQTRANTCSDGLGSCDNCDERCKAKHGPSGESYCDRTIGVPLCVCYYECPSPPRPTPPKTCDGGAGLCSQKCPQQCCNSNCAQKYTGGQGFCITLGSYNLCQCEYPC